MTQCLRFVNGDRKSLLRSLTRTSSPRFPGLAFRIGRVCVDALRTSRNAPCHCSLFCSPPCEDTIRSCEHYCKSCVGLIHMIHQCTEQLRMSRMSRRRFCWFVCCGFPVFAEVQLLLGCCQTPPCPSNWRGGGVANSALFRKKHKLDLSHESWRLQTWSHLQ